MKSTIAKAIYHMISGFRVSIGETPYQDYELVREDYREFLEGAVDLVNSRPDITPKEIHDYWMDWALKNKTYHKSIIPFEKLSATEKMKDQIVIDVIKLFNKF